MTTATSTINPALIDPDRHETQPTVPRDAYPAVTKPARCKLCRAMPMETTGGSVVCRSVTCPIAHVPLSYDQWAKLHGPGLFGETP